MHCVDDLGDFPIIACEQPPARRVRRYFCLWKVHAALPCPALPCPLIFVQTDMAEEEGVIFVDRSAFCLV